MHIFVFLYFNLILVSSTCFEHPSVHPQEELYMAFLSCIHISSLVRNMSKTLKLD